MCRGRKRCFGAMPDVDGYDGRVYAMRVSDLAPYQPITSDDICARWPPQTIGNVADGVRGAVEAFGRAKMARVCV